jgi:hypothetical protein
MGAVRKGILIDEAARPRWGFPFIGANAGPTQSHPTTGRIVSPPPRGWSDLIALRSSGRSHAENASAAT